MSFTEKFKSVRSKRVKTNSKMKELIASVKKIAASLDEFAVEVENMDILVEDQDRQQFDNIIHKYLSKVDPTNELSIHDSVLKMSLSEAQNMINELLELHYHEEV